MEHLPFYHLNAGQDRVRFNHLFSLKVSFFPSKIILAEESIIWEKEEIIGSEGKDGSRSSVIARPLPTCG